MGLPDSAAAIEWWGWRSDPQMHDRIGWLLDGGFGGVLDADVAGSVPEGGSHAASQRPATRAREPLT